MKMSEQKRKRGRPTNRSCARSIFSPEKKLELLRMIFSRLFVVLYLSRYLFLAIFSINTTNSRITDLN